MSPEQDDARETNEELDSESRQLQEEEALEERRDTRKIWILAVVAALVLFGIALLFLDPPYPRRLVLAAGPSDGLYFQFAQRYREVLAKDGIAVEVRETAGSAENLALLSVEGGGADVAFVQGGVATDEHDARLRSLASLFLEPVWIFHRLGADAVHLQSFAGKRIAVGPPGSGTRALALQLLEATGVAAGSELVPLGGAAAAAALREGAIDAAFFVIGARGKYLPDLLADESLRLLPVERRDAYVRRYPFLKSVDVPEGVLDLEANLPRSRLQVIAPRVALVADRDLHTALIPLFIEAAKTIHGPGGLLEAPGAFPSPAGVDVPLHEDARRYFETGPSWLHRTFPFWIANLLNRLVILLVPLLTLLFPLFKAAPPLVRWRIRRRIVRWYRSLHEADELIAQEPGADRLRKEIARLQAIDKNMSTIKVPLGYMEEFFHLRLHIDYMLRRLAEARDGASGP